MQGRLVGDHARRGRHPVHDEGAAGDDRVGDRRQDHVDTTTDRERREHPAPVAGADEAAEEGRSDGSAHPDGAQQEPEPTGSDVEVPLGEHDEEPAGGARRQRREHLDDRQAGQEGMAADGTDPAQYAGPPPDLDVGAGAAGPEIPQQQTRRREG